MSGLDLVRFVKTVLFPRVRKSLKEVLADQSLASLGDSYVSFIYSLAVSNRKGQPIGIKAKGSILTGALRKARLRGGELPSQMSTHSLADAPESLIVYAWLNERIGLEESVEIATKEKDPVCDLTRLLAVIRKRTTFA